MLIGEIEEAITHLSSQELVELTEWLENYHAQKWDEQIEADLETGHLDKVLRDVDSEHARGLSRPL